jgi:hypothetical protein
LVVSLLLARAPYGQSPRPTHPKPSTIDPHTRHERRRQGDSKRESEREREREKREIESERERERES